MITTNSNCFCFILTRFKNGLEIGTGGRHKVKVDGDTHTLTISDITSADAGEISCEVRNALGKESCKANLSVLCKC